jgi:hypothetical protein
MTTTRQRIIRGASLLAALAVTAPVVAGGDAAAPSLSVRVADPPVVTFDSTALGRATHSLRISVTNQGRTPVPLEPLAVRFRPTRDGIVFACEDPRSRDDRWPATLEAGATFGFSREVTCDTPLPGRYDVEVRARSRSADASTERSVTSFAIQIDPGSNPPVRLPWDPALHGAASGTKDMRPSKDPAAARIVVALINATRAAVPLGSVRATTRVTRRGSSVHACAERGVDLAFTGALPAGRSQTLSMPLGCELSVEALYDVDVSITNASGAKVRLATHAIRVIVNAPSSPGPQDEL